jgi:tRNA-2-methylthio-N6-dimethylallyladenosine synthase
MNKKVYLKSWGCQMNVRDSEVICGLLKKEDFVLINEPENADVVIFNTCSVRQHAEEKVWSEIGRYKARGPSLSLRTNHARKKIIGVIGCMAQNYKDEIFRRAPQVDFVVGPSDIHKIPEIIKSVSARRYTLSAQDLFETKIWETDGGFRPEEIYHTGYYQDKEHAFVVISEGCSNFCSYCVVPYVRGALRNRSCKDILKEIEEAIDKGITKITLLGQNVNSYESPGHQVTRSPVRFVELLKLVNGTKGLKEFSFITSHPKDTSLDLFRAMGDCEKLKKYLHLPVQSGSDKILKLMNRGYIRKFYLDLLENYRKIVRNGVLTTDIIVGFPTESEADFQDTYNLIKEIQFDAAYIFKYSPRPNTEALKYADDVTREEKEKRHKLTLDLQKEISRSKAVNDK